MCGCEGPAPAECLGHCLATSLYDLQAAGGSTSFKQATTSAHKCLLDAVLASGAFGSHVICHPNAAAVFFKQGGGAGVPGPIDILQLAPWGNPTGALPDQAYWRLRKALAWGLLRGCTWAKQFYGVGGAKYEAWQIAPMPADDYEAAYQNACGPWWPSPKPGCNCWAVSEIAAGNVVWAKLAEAHCGKS
jgi:hypothetical protein